jgi:sortase A
VEDGDSVTWDIPKFVAGHAESTAGAGQVGNAVVLGHLISRTLGNVFENLDRTRPGDVLHVRSGAQEFNYTVVDVRNVDRLDVDVLDPTSTPTITLITCAGVWNPLLHDYMERLIVRGELMSPGQL